MTDSLKITPQDDGTAIIDRCPRCGKEDIPGRWVDERRIVSMHLCPVPDQQIEIKFNTEPVKVEYDLMIEEMDL